MQAEYQIINNSIIISFEKSPSIDIRNTIKSSGFTWNTRNNAWTAPFSIERENCAKKVVEEAQRLPQTTFNQVASSAHPSQSSKTDFIPNGDDSLLKQFTENDIIELPVSEEVYNKTLVNTVKKFNYTLKNSIKSRTHSELITDLFMGDLAKNSLVDYLRKNCKNQPIICDYDEIRIDDFKKPDPWDFYINDKDNYKVEVKSSTPPVKKTGIMETSKELIRGRDIKILAKKTAGQEETSPINFDCFVFPQIYFNCRIPKGRYFSAEELLKLEKDPMFLEQLVNLTLFMHPLFFGWAAKTDIIFFMDRLKVPKWEYGNAVYWSCPLRYARSIKELIDFADQTKKRG